MLDGSIRSLCPISGRVSKTRVLWINEMKLLKLSLYLIRTRFLAKFGVKKNTQMFSVASGADVIVDRKQVGSGFKECNSIKSVLS